jgi:asparagine synthase (glutamine-hydrolysing)
LRDPRAAAEALEAQLAASAARHLMSDVRLGILLSGGLDSSGVASFAVEAGAADLASFTLRFDVPGKNEVALARLVARTVGTDHHEGVATARSMEETLPIMAASYGEPFADSSAIPTRDVCRLARRLVKVALSGDGGDELFGGYTHYRRWIARQPWYRAPRSIRSAITRASTLLVPAGSRAERIVDVLSRTGLSTYGALMELFSPAEKRLLAGPVLSPVLRDYDDHWLFRRYWRPDLDPLTRLQYIDVHTFLVDDILTKVDRAGMSCGLEVRPVLLDHDLVQLAFSIPATTRSGWLGLGGKRLLRSVLRRRLPAAVLAQRKSGFSAPVDAWLSRDRAKHIEQLRTGPLVAAGILQARGLDRLAASLGGMRLWGLIVLDRCFSAGWSAAVDAPAPLVAGGVE